MNDTPTTSILPATTHLGPVTLAVADLTRAIEFYTRIIGLRVLTPPSAHSEAHLGVADRPLLRLVALPNARRPPTFSTGLFHVAILLPSRADLGRVLHHLIRHQASISRLGSADHLVSEALYLNDPDGNGLEIYRDRPRSEWTWHGSQVAMDTIALDADGILAAVPDPETPFAGLPDGTVIGHVHLRVGDLAQAQAFYGQVMGFDLASQFPGALFMSAGGYHHHLGLNVWQSKGAPPAPADSTGLREYVILLPDAASLQAVKARVAQAGAALIDPTDTGFVTQDPWGNAIRVTRG